MTATTVGLPTGMALPMLCNDAGKDGPTDSPGAASDWQVERKHDGWRALIWVDPAGTTHIFGGRNGEDYTGQLPYLEREIASVLPPDTVIDGELIADEWGTVQGAMTRHGYSGHEIELVVFDMVQLCGRDLRKAPLRERRAALEQSDIFPWGDPFVCPNVILNPAFTGFSIDLLRGHHLTLVRNGAEGTVWKKLSSPYLSGRRSPYWMKWKHETTDDWVCTGFEPGKGKYKGQVGAIKFTTDVRAPNGALVESQASGMDDATRAEMTAHPEKWVGQLIEIKHNGLMKSGKPRHPQYLRLRSDRRPEPKPSSSSPRSSTRSTRAPRAGGWMRNYAAMGDGKLMTALRELEQGYGDAVSRVEEKGGSLAAHVNKAVEVARNRGLR